MLTATQLLKNRLRSIEDQRKNAGLDPMPTLADIEKTHIIFTNAHFKPFAAMAFEYQKTNASSGSSELNSEVTFSINQFGDFIYDMCLHVQLKQPTLSITAGTDASDEPGMRWCNWIGERLCSETSFSINGNPLDSYKRDAYNFERETKVSKDKLIGWQRMMGQEEARKGFVDQANWAGSGVASAAVTHRVSTEVFNGHQTPTGQKSQAETGDVELFIPLLFWFNRDPRLALPSVAIPHGQRFVTVKLAAQEDLVSTYPRGAGTDAAPNGTILTTTNLVRKIELYVNNIFVNPEIHDIYIKRIAFTLVRVHRQQEHTANVNTAEVHLQNLKWPIESLCVGMRVKNYNGTSVELRSQGMDKWHTFSQVTDTAFTSAGWSQRKTTALTGSIATHIAATGVVTGTATAFDTELAVDDAITINGVVYYVGVATSATSITVYPLPSADLAAATTDLKKITVEELSSTVKVCVPTIDRMSIRAHGIEIYKDFPVGFFNAYLPYRFGGHNLNTPEDCGVMFVPFGLYPGTYQPNGHLNVSRAREFYLDYTSAIISSSVQGTLIVLAIAINFLLVSDGSAVLRYST
jgi:hypothetical protein